MSKKLLIDATQAEETRIAVVHNDLLEEFDSELTAKRPMKGNIYLAKVMRVEPALQAAFIEFGGGRQGFLAFGEIHSDYYTFPKDKDEAKPATPQPEVLETIVSEDVPETPELPATELNAAPLKPVRRPRYRIQDVIRRKQVLLVQVIKEERGNKGAAFSTYLSLPGRYCVFMPNAGHHSGGISRKIVDDQDRKRLRDMLDDFDLPDTMGVIVRTAGFERTKLEIKRDLEYAQKLWTDIQAKAAATLQVPSLVYTEGDLVKKAIRDIYTRDMEEIWVAGEEAYRLARAFVKTLMPSHMRKVQLYKDATLPLFQKYRIEEQIEHIAEPSVRLSSGGSIVISPTEALIAIDVNSGKSIKEKHIDDTALYTNLEAAHEIARQLRLRDLGGLIVIDFIDMSDARHIAQVERHFRDAIKSDRARIQVGKMSVFGLLELSRQRLKPSFTDTHSVVCSHCRGTGLLRSVESTALHVMRHIETEAIHNRTWKEVVVRVPQGIALYILNHKRQSLVQLEQRLGCSMRIAEDPVLISPECRIDVISQEILPPPEPEAIVVNLPPEEGGVLPVVSQDNLQPPPVEKKRTRRRRPRRKPSESQVAGTPKILEGSSVVEVTPEPETLSPPLRKGWLKWVEERLTSRI